MTRCCRLVEWAALTAAMLCQGGCVLGPRALRVSRVEYNQAIQTTTNEELLLNLVRLKYRDPPFFLGVGSVSAQFIFEKSGEASGTLNENVGVDPINPDALTLRGRLGYSEKPTITYVPLQGEDFVQRLLTPVPLETILLLQGSGWRIDRVLRLTVQQINGLDNATSASGPTPRRAPQYEDFARMTGRLRELQLRGVLRFGYRPAEENLSDPVPAGMVDGEDLVTAANQGYAWRSEDAGRTFTLKGEKRTLVLEIAPSELDSDAVRELVELLNLAPGESRYNVSEGLFVPGISGAAAKSETLTARARSLMGTLFYLCQAVEIPREHVERGWVTQTLDAEGQPFEWHRVTGDLLRVHTRRNRPVRAAVAVPYRGHWFYIDDDDLNSKSTFSLLAQLFALQAGSAEGVAPVLTLPVGG